VVYSISKPLNVKAMKKYNGSSIRKVETATGKIPDNVGFSSGGGFVRKLTKKELDAQARFTAWK